MKAYRSFKKRGSPDCPISIARYEHNMYLPPKPHYHPEVEIAYIQQGHILCTLDEDAQLHLSAGDILILAPEQTHLYQSPSVDAQIRFLIFSLDALTMVPPHIFQQEFVQPLKEGTLQLPQVLQPSHPAYEEVVRLLDKDFPPLTNGPQYKIHRYCALVNICTALLPWCAKKDTFPVRVNSNHAVRSAMVYIHNRYHLPLTLTKIANHVHLNPSYLSDLFKTHTGQTVTQYLSRIRIDAAVLILRNSDLTISQIAEKTGFRSESAFYHHFQELMGTSPRAFRQASQKEA